MDLAVAAKMQVFLYVHKIREEKFEKKKVEVWFCCSLGDSESGYQASPCYSKTKLQLFLLQPPKLQEQQLSRWPCQDQAELPRGLRGVDQQADQYGILCLVRLSFHEFLLQPGRSSPPWIRCSLQDGVR